MPFIKLQFRPGINRDQTNYTGEGGWYAGNKVRFRSGFPEKIGGWLQDGNSTFLGTCRQMWSWVTTYGDNFLALGTNIKLYIQNGLGGSFSDITPLRASNPTYVWPDTANCIYTVAGSNVVTVTLSTYPGATVGNYVDLSGVPSTAFTVSFSNEYVSTGAIWGTALWGSALWGVGAANVLTTLIRGSNLPGINTPVQFATTGTLPTGFTAGATYYVVSCDGNSNSTTITVSATQGGSPILATDTGTGTQTMTCLLGGIPASELNGTHLIATVDTPANSLTFTTTTVATATTATGCGGTSIQVDFETDTGYASATYGYGWGTGSWGRGAWGSSSDQPIILPQQDWWLDYFDNDLVANIRNGAPYYWERGLIDNPSTALSTRAIPLATYAANVPVDQGGPFDPAYVPVKVGQLLVSQQDKHLLAFGAVPYASTNAADFDPLLIRWASQDSPGQWEPRTTNSAGDLRVSRGSRIVRALATRQEILIWSDSNLYTLQFLGTTDVFGLQEYADNISIASPRSVAVAANVVYWMGQDKFYAYTGRVETLPCTLRNHVFMNINFNQADQIICGTNEQWNEIWWFYPKENSQWNDAYVVYNYLDKVWYYGDMERTAWLDTPLRHWPQAATTAQNSTTGRIYNHENGITENGLPMDAYIQSNDFDIEDGEQFMLMRRIIPDIEFADSVYPSDPNDPQPKVTLEIKSRNFPGSTFNTNTDDAASVVSAVVDTYTDQVFLRARARQMAFKISSSDAITQWQLGSPRLDARTDGKR